MLLLLMELMLSIANCSLAAGVTVAVDSEIGFVALCLLHVFRPKTKHFL